MYMNKTNSGITMIDVVVYLGILSIFMASFMPWFFDLYIWKNDLEINTQLVNEYLFIEGILADVARNSEEISEDELGDSFYSVSFEIDRHKNFNTYSFLIYPNGLNVGSTTYPFEYE